MGGSMDARARLGGHRVRFRAIWVVRGLCLFSAVSFCLGAVQAQGARGFDGRGGISRIPRDDHQSLHPDLLPIYPCSMLNFRSGTLRALCIVCGDERDWREGLGKVSKVRRYNGSGVRRMLRGGGQLNKGEGAKGNGEEGGESVAIEADTQSSG
eukprot:1341237-Amorphochlora_amoeboformis.AAC.2